jgi:HEAT repeat protein
VLIAEDASARLASLRDPHWRARAKERVRKLRLRLREPARAFVAAPPEHHVPGNVQEYRQRQLASARRLDQLAEGQRVMVMEALAPGLGAALARWWAEAQGWPYQRGWNRKAFRALRAPELTVEARASELYALVELVGPFDADPVWLAGWGGHLAMGRAPVASTIGGVLACAIDLGGRCGEETLATLMAVGSGEHPVGRMGRHVVVGLLGSSRTEGWEFVERLLLAAQRQEGLRQVILEAADEGCPGAFDRILATVLDHKLLRFAAAVRAVGVWLGFGASVADIPQVEARVRTLATFRASSAERTRALAGSDPWDAYVALCAQGMRDVQATIPEAQALARHPAPRVRAAAVRYAAATGLMPGQRIVATALDDEDVGVASLAVVLLSHDGWTLPGAFDALTRLIPRLPVKARALDDLGAGSAPVRVSRALAAGFLVNARGRRPVNILVPWLPSMDATGRFWAAAQIAREPLLTAELRDALIKLLSDRSSRVRQCAVRALGRTRLARSEVPAMEALLTRRATDIRRAALTLLASLPPRAARASVGRLAASTDERQRAAATELARLIGVEAPAGHGVAKACEIRAAGGPAALSVAAPMARGGAPLEDLRVTLVEEHARTQPLVPLLPHRGRSFGDDCARGIVQALDELVHERRNTPVRLAGWQGSREVLLGDIWWGLASPFPGARIGPVGAAGGGEMVLGEVFCEWWQARPAALRRENGLDALRAYATAALATAAAPSPAVQQDADWWLTGMRQLVGGAIPKLRYPVAVRHVAAWLAVEHASAKAIEECLDALEASLATVPDSVLTAVPPNQDAGHDGFVAFAYQPPIPYRDWRHRLGSHPWHRVLAGLLGARAQAFTAEQLTRWFRLMRWVEQPYPGAPPLPVDERLLVAAHEAEAATQDDIIASLLHPRSGLFRDLTRHGRSQSQGRAAARTVIADAVRNRVIAVELQRGDLPTPTSKTALNIASTSGAALAVRLLRLLGDSPLARSRTSGHDSRDAVFSHLLRVSFPAPADPPETLAAAAHQAGVPPGRLVDLAVYAPQWAPLVE